MQDQEHHLSASDAPIHKVKLHPEEAIVTRQWTWTTPCTGRFFILIPVAGDADPQRVVAKATLHPAESSLGPPPLQIAVQSLRPIDESTTTPSPRRAPLDDNHVHHRLRLLEHHARIARRAFSQDWTHGEPRLEDWQNFFRKYETSHAELALATSSATSSHQRQSPSSILKMALELSLPETQPGDHLTVSLTYHTQLVSWEPYYELRAHPVLDDEGYSTDHVRIDTVLVAYVEQHTHETWSDIDLSLHPSPIDIPQHPPQLSRLLLSGFQGPARGGTDERTLTSKLDGPSYSQSGLRELTPPVTIPGHGQRVRIELKHISVDARVKLVAHTEGPPTVRRLVYGPLPTRLIPAPAYLIWNGTLIGQSYWPPYSSSDDDPEIDFGPDSSIQILRHWHRAPPKRSRMSQRLEHGFEMNLEIKNLNPKPKDVEVRGRIPIADSSEVEVELRSVPSTTVVAPDSGYTHSVLRLPAEGQRSITYRFSVHAPRTVVVDEPEAT